MLNSAIYNGYTFQTSADITLQNSNDDAGWTQQVDRFSFPNTDGTSIINVQKREKIISLSGKIKGSSKADVNNKIRILKTALAKPEQTLTIKVEFTVGTETTLQGTATPVNTSTIITRGGTNTTFAYFSIDFLLSKGYTEGSTVTESGIGETTDITITPTYAGSTKTFTDLLLTINTIGDIAKIKFQIGSNTIIVEATYTASDVLEIDCEDFNVFLNSSAQDYSGFFPSFFGETINIIFLNSLDASASSYDVDYSLTYKPRYI